MPVGVCSAFVRLGIASSSVNSSPSTTGEVVAIGQMHKPTWELAKPPAVPSTVATAKASVLQLFSPRSQAWIWALTTSVMIAPGGNVRVPSHSVEA
jgi:hypothetical protein